MGGCHKRKSKPIAGLYPAWPG